ncbi:Aspartic proteinase nepenthesin-2 [Linum grandiflorum]
MSSSSLSYPLLLLSFSTVFLLSTAAITIPLSPSTASSATSSASLHQILSHLASTSLARALHLKSISTTTSSSIYTASLAAVKSPLFPRSYGGYSISLSFGTPPQTTKFVMDTGSSLVWFPCTPRYSCSRCNFPNVNPSNIPTFLPKNSATAAVLPCSDPKCKLFYGNDVVSQCSASRTNLNCPPYLIQYGSGSTSGVLLTETLDFPNKTVPDFLVGCSIDSSSMPEGIAGFGRGNDSLPSQIGAKRFSHCMVSHGFDDSPVSTDLVLDLDSRRKKKTPAVSYTPFEKILNSSNSAFETYYYVPLRQILVEGKRVKVPYSYLDPNSRSSAGNGGTIVDSGTTFTYMERPVYDAVVKEIKTRMSNYTEAKTIQDLTGLGPCFNVSGGGDGSGNNVAVPELSFKFKGGAEMKLPATNYFVLADDGVVCLTIVSDDVVADGGHVGPAIIVGNYQQRDYYVEYDLEAERFGFKPQICAA